MGYCVTSTHSGHIDYFSKLNSASTELFLPTCCDFKSVSDGGGEETCMLVAARGDGFGIILSRLPHRLLGISPARHHQQIEVSACALAIFRCSEQD